MKKALIGAALALSLLAATNAETNSIPNPVHAVSLSAVTDTMADENGIRAQFLVGKADFSITHVNDQYNRFALGRTYTVWTNGPLDFNVVGALAYQNGLKNVKDGFGGTAGLNAEYKFDKNVSAIASYEYFLGENDIKSSNGNVFTLGAKVKF